MHKTKSYQSTCRGRVIKLIKYLPSQEIHEPSALVPEWICQEGQKLLTCRELQGLPSFSFQTAC